MKNSTLFLSILIASSHLLREQNELKRNEVDGNLRLLSRINSVGFVAGIIVRDKSFWRVIL